MQTIQHFLSTGFINIAPFFILLGLLIFVHELGHFLVARWCGVRVETFSLGFGKKIFQWKPADTTYCISIVPLGGYVKMYGDDPTADIPMEERKYAFLHKKVWQRFAVVLAGPMMNLIFALFLFMVIARVGEEVAGPQVGDLAADSAAVKAGFKTGDKILKINGTAVKSWNQSQSIIESSANKSLTFDVERADHSQQQVVTTPLLGANDNILSTQREVGKIEGLTNESASTVLGVKPDSVAAKAGLQTFDLVTAINDKAVASFNEMIQRINEVMADSGGDIVFKVRNVEADEKPENARTVHIAKSSLKKDHVIEALGVENAELYIMKVKPGSPAATAGIAAKDRIVGIGTEDVKSWNEVLNKVKNFSPGSAPIHFSLLHDGKIRQVDITPELTEVMGSKGQEEKRYTIGVVSAGFKVGPEPVLLQLKNPIDIAVRGAQQTAEWTWLEVMSIVRLVQGQVSAKNISGVITIGRVASRSFEIGLSAFLKTMAIISLNLFLLNLLPIPVLDGGHLLFFSVEALKGTPISLKKLEIAQQVGLTLLIMLMAFALFNDISNFLTARW